MKGDGAAPGLGQDVKHPLAGSFLRRLAALGELGRYPLFIKALSQCFNHKMSLLGPDRHNSLVSDVDKNAKFA